MWEYCNAVLHSEEGGVHKDKLEAINKAIRIEFTIGLNELQNEMGSFFRGMIDRKLAMNPNSKIQQLTSIWFERYRIQEEQGLTEQYKELLMTTLLMQERMQKKRRRYEDFAAL